MNTSLKQENVSVVIYESDNPNVASVAADGTLTLKKNGTIYITAKSEDVAIETS